MSDDTRAMLGGDLSHDEAQTLVSMRMDGPLDIERIRQLNAHLAGCPACASFAAAMEGIAVGFRELPLLPPSPVVARAVRAEVRKGGLFRSLGRLMATNRALPLSALGAATVALAIVAASTFGSLRDGGGGPQVAAPLAATTAAEAAYASGAADARKTSAPPNVQVEPTEEPPTVAAVIVTATVEVAATEPMGDEPTAVMILAAETGEALPAEPTAPQPTAAPATATDTPRPVATATDEPTATATETAEPTATATPAATATGIIVVTAEADEQAAEPTVESDAGESSGGSPAIKPREDAAPTGEAAIGGDAGDAAAGGAASADANADADAGSGQAIVQRGSGGADDADTGAAGSDVAGSGEAADTSLMPGAAPLAFGDLVTTGASLDVSGTLLPAIVGDYYAVELPGGLFWVLDGDGAVVDEGYGYVPVWSSDAPVAYTANAVIAEGTGAIIAWDAAAGASDFATGGVDADDLPVFDTPVAWVAGDLWFLRFRADGSPLLELRTLNGGEQLWASDGYALVGQNAYATGGAVYAPTDAGWLVIMPGKPEELLGGDVVVADEVVLAPDGDQVAFIGGGRVLLADAWNPGAAVDVGAIDGGGIAWTPYGLVIADGAGVRLVDQGVEVTLVTDGDGLSAPVWSDNGLLIRGGDGEIRLLPTADLEAMLGR